MYSEVWYRYLKGQVLVPVLFTIYVNDLLNLEINGNILNYTLYNINLAFADTVLFFEGETWTSVK